MIFLIFIFIPIIEISIFITIGSKIGVFNTISIIILTAIIGIFFIRRQGISLLFNAQRNMRDGIFPTQEIKGAIFLLVSGLLLITPGFLTDIIGLMLIIHPTRKFFLHVFLYKIFSIVVSFDTFFCSWLIIVCCREDIMGIGKFFCKLGFHNGEPVGEENELNDDQNQRNPEDLQNREVRCVRCGIVYTELVGVSSVWYGHP